MKKIGIIGGAGPEAGALVFRNLTTLYQNKGAWHDHDFPQMMLLNYPFSSMLESDQNKLKIVKELQSAVDILSSSKSDIVGIACNTLHSFVENIDFKQMEFVSITNAVVSYILKENISKVLFLGTKTSVNNKIYDKAHIEIIYPNLQHQEYIHDTIVKVMKKTHTQQDAILLSNIINNCYKNVEFSGVILGCTELSVIHQNWNISGPLNVKLFDSIQILAENLYKPIT